MKILSLSLITPVYSGGRYLPKLLTEIQRLKDHLDELACPIKLVETICVVDGAVDDSEFVLRQEQHKYDWLRVVVLSKNFGQHPATIAGILHTSGDWIVTLDEDLQHHPIHIPKMIKAAIVNEVDIIYANPERNVHGSIYRDMGSKGFKWLLSNITGNKHIRMFNSYRLMRGEIGRAAAAVSINRTYFDLALNWFTSKIASIKLPMLDERYKQSKKSGYSLRKLLSHSFRMIQTTDMKVIRIGAAMGLFTMLLSILFGFFTLFMRLFSPDLITMDGWASIIISVMFLGGMNAFLLGLVLENLSIILMHTHGKPTFFEVDRTTDMVLKEFFATTEST